MAVAIDRFRATGDEAGTPPGDRRFRPDVQGLRAVAILLVVLFHADVPGIRGGYVGVDVFFVISGFVITGVLLRERAKRGRPSILAFYGRRARRIIPAASLVIVITVVAAYHYLGPLIGHATATDGQWAALFLANFHFAATQTNYLASQEPPSSLQNFWSLAVEEQFYLVYPTIFLVTSRLMRQVSFRARLSVVLGAVIVSSYTYSIVFTASNPSSAFFSPFTRAWELALGALIAVSGPSLRRIPQRWAGFASWLGLTAIVVAGVTLTASTVYPGWLVALPVLGAGLVIGGGAAQPTWGAECLLRQRPFQLLGLISYSLYLWHWPILVIASQSRGTSSLPTWDNIMLLLLAVLVSVVTYRLVENPVRHAVRLRRTRWASIVLGLCLIAATLIVTTYEQHRPTVDLGSLTTVTSGSTCPSPSPTAVSRLRSTFTSGRSQGAKDAGLKQVVVVGDSTACTLLPGLQAVGPSYGLRFEDGAVIGCGVVSGLIAPYYYGNVNISSYTEKCQGEANLAETQAIERYRPGLVVWVSTDERNSIVVDTPSGSKVLASGSAAWKSVMLQRMNNRVEKFVASGAKVLLLLEPPQAYTAGQLGASADSSDLQYANMNELLTEVAAKHPSQVAVVNLETRVCPSGPPCPFVVDGFGSGSKGETTIQAIAKAIRPDEVHYSGTSSLWVARWLVPRIASADKKLS